MESSPDDTGEYPFDAKYRSHRRVSSRNPFFPLDPVEKMFAKMDLISSL